MEAFLDTQPDFGPDPTEQRRQRAERQPRERGRFASAEEQLAEANEEIEAEVAEDADEVREPEEADEATAQSDGSINTWDEMAAAFDVAPDELAAHLTIELGGEQVPLSQVLEAARSAPDAVARSEAVRAKEAELSGLIDRQQREYGTKLYELQNALETMVQLENQAERPDWQRLKDEDPIEYAKQWAEHQQKSEAFKRSHELLMREAEKRERESQREHEKWIENEGKALVEHPEAKDWVEDNELAQAEAKQMEQYLLAHRGFSPDDLVALEDHRYVLVVRDAMRYRALTSKGKLAVKKVRETPKIITPGARVSEREASTRRRREVLGRHRADGSVATAAAAFEEIL